MAIKEYLPEVIATRTAENCRRHPFFKGSWKWRIGAICLCAILLGVIYHPEYVPGQRGQQQAARQPSVLKSGAGVDVASGRLPRWLGNEGWETSRAVPEPAADDEMVAQGRDGIVGRFHAMLKAILSRRVNDKPGEYGPRNRGIRADAPLLSVLSTARSQAEASEVKRQRSAGTVFRDCEECPQMVVLPSGSFMMGSPDGEEGRDEDESPRHLVKIEYRFAVGVYEVTFDEWEACVAAGGCGGYVPNDKNWGRGERPVINVSWDDAQSYVSWLSKRTGVSYRLLSESEWEYAARAGTTTTRYSWGDDIGANLANCRSCGSRWDAQGTAPVGWFPANAWGLHDMRGNVWEWVQDCWNDHYLRAPADGSAWERGNCSRRVLRGGSWVSIPRNLRSANRLRFTSVGRLNDFGFRVARTVTP